jgi:hypothetical protein
VDDSFAFRTTVRVRRQIDPRLVKAAVGLALVSLATGLFANWVITSERESFSAIDRSQAEESPALPAEALPTAPGTMRDASEAIRVALTAAEATHAVAGSYVDADPAGLDELQPGYIFVDGPSTASRIVSVSSTRRSWAAAVLGPDGTCLWVRTTAGGEVVRGKGGECTGTAALAADRP